MLNLFGELSKACFPLLEDVTLAFVMSFPIRLSIVIFFSSRVFGSQSYLLAQHNNLLNVFHDVDMIGRQTQTVHVMNDCVSHQKNVDFYKFWNTFNDVFS